MLRYADAIDYWRDLRAGYSDLLGFDLVPPWVERMLAAVQSEPIVGFRGGNGTSKSHTFGQCAAIFIPTHLNSHTLFLGPKLDQTRELAWRDMRLTAQRVKHKRTIAGQEYEMPLGGNLLAEQWRFNDDWWAKVMAAGRESDQAVDLSGVLHCAGSKCALLEEMTAIRHEVLSAVLGAMTGAEFHLWFSFNPFKKSDAAGALWATLPEAARVHVSALEVIEWQECTGTTIPGVASRSWLDRVARPQWGEGTPQWTVRVLGEFPDESEEWVTVPESWSRRVTNCIPAPTSRDRRQACIGVDTGWGGSAETVLACVVGRVVQPLAIYPRLRDVPGTAGHISRLAGNLAGVSAVSVAVDVVGTGGAGVHDIVKGYGMPVMAVQGGATRFCDEPIPDLYGDCITWAWWEVRERVRRTIEVMDAEAEAGEAPGTRVDAYEISLPDDDVLRSQLARPYEVRGDRKVKLMSKDDLADKGIPSPDRADALAMAVLGLCGRPGRFAMPVDAVAIAP
jgi:hypothetical protein